MKVNYVVNGLALFDVQYFRLIDQSKITIKLMIKQLS